MTVEEIRNGRGVRFDVYFEDEKHTFYDFEMQTTKQKDLPGRTRYYQSLIDATHLDRGEKYNSLPDSYIVFIRLSDPFDKDQYKYTFENRCVDTVGDLSLEDGSYKIFLNTEEKEVPGIRTSKALVNFLNYVKGKPSSDKLTRAIDRAVKNARLDEKGRRLYMTLLERDEEKRAEGRVEGAVMVYYTVNHLSPEAISRKMNVPLTAVKDIISKIK